MEAISVPSPPKFTPSKSCFKSLENPDNNNAAGTLLITWLATSPTKSSLPFTNVCRKIIIDLRENEGGVLPIAIQMINEFLDADRLILYTQGQAQPRTDYKSNGKGQFKDLRVDVLISEFSASASEIFAGAIQDNDRGLIIGRRSFGKGLVQEQRMLPDGSALRLTVARYYTDRKSVV